MKEETQKSKEQATETFDQRVKTVQNILKEKGLEIRFDAEPKFIPDNRGGYVLVIEQKLTWIDLRR